MKKHFQVRRPFRIIGALAVSFLGLVYLFGAQPDPFSAFRAHETPPPADVKQLEADVKWLSQTEFPRDYTSSIIQKDIVSTIEKRFAKLGFEIKKQHFKTSEGWFENISALTKSQPSIDRIVIGAHYDSCGKRPAADDNASGVAGLLELARLISIKSPSTTVELVAYANEEPPFFGTNEMGSYFHAKALSAQKIPVRAMMSLEMIGYFDDKPGSQNFPFPLLKLFYPNKGNFIAVVGDLSSLGLVRKVKEGLARRSEGLDVYSFNAPHFVPGVDWSDQRNYWDEGFPAVMITDTSFLRNKEYHKDGDTWDRLDYPRMGKVVSALYQSLFDY
jgi:hypothetical protein